MTDSRKLFESNDEDLLIFGLVCWPLADDFRLVVLVNDLDGALRRNLFFLNSVLDQQLDLPLACLFLDSELL